MVAKAEFPVILFDLDGTLIDSTEAILESFEESFRSAAGEMPDEESIKSLIGLPLPDMFRLLGAGEDMVHVYVRNY